MRRHRTRRPSSAALTLRVDHRTPPAFRRRIAGSRFSCTTNATLLVNDDASELEIAEAAWRILKQTGGLVDRPAIAARFGLSRQRTYEMTNNKSFPAPVGELGDRPVWLTVHVDRYRAQAKPGRPRHDPQHE
jgi:predicted DNA-binding transcriptional regulator AlpA